MKPRRNTEEQPAHDEQYDQLHSEVQSRQKVRQILGAIVAGAVLFGGTFKSPDIDLSVTLNSTDTVEEVETIPGIPLDTPQIGTALETVKQTQVINEAWAELFSQDPHAGEVTQQSQVDSVSQRVVELTSQGYSIDKIEMQGFASDEDDAQQNGGIGEANPKNIDLANLRALTLYPELQQSVASTGAAAEIQIDGGVEDILTQEEQGKMAWLATISQTNVTNLIKQYNRDPGSLRPAIVQELDGMLKAERNVTVTIIASRETPPLPSEMPKDTVIKTVKVIDSSGTVGVRFNVEIPILLPVLGILPIIAKLEARETVIEETPRDKTTTGKRSSHNRSETIKPVRFAQKPIKNRGRTHMTDPGPHF